MRKPQPMTVRPATPRDRPLNDGLRLRLRLRLSTTPKVSVSGRSAHPAATARSFDRAFTPHQERHTMTPTREKLAP